MEATELYKGLMAMPDNSTRPMITRSRLVKAFRCTDVDWVPLLLCGSRGVGGSVLVSEGKDTLGRFRRMANPMEAHAKLPRRQ